jgi:hypothetical protein
MQALKKEQALNSLNRGSSLENKLQNDEVGFTAPWCIYFLAIQFSLGSPYKLTSDCIFLNLQ